MRNAFNFYVPLLLVGIAFLLNIKLAIGILCLVLAGILIDKNET